MSSLIKLENVTKTYYLQETAVAALQGIYLQIKKGEMTAIMGASGSGKSTLMNIIGFLDHCTEGQYWFAGEDVSSLSVDQLADIRNQKIGFVFQSFFLLAKLTAVENVILPLFYRNTSRALAKEMAMHVLEKVGMAKFARHHPNQLSGGQQQRVAIARAIVGNPDIILADEPTGALDSQTGSEVMELFADLNEKENRTIVIITHDKEISHRCKRVVTIKDGQLKELT